VLSLQPPARSDLVYFAKGGELQIPAETKAGVVRLEAPNRSYEFLPSDFRKIIPGYWPAQEWPTRRAKALGGRADDRFRALWWALENGLTPEAVALLRESHRLDPTHPPTTRLAAALAKLDKPCSETLPDLARLKSGLGDHYDVTQGPHIVLLHQHPAAEAEERVDLLERVTTTYYLMLAGQGIELPVPPRRMASAWFAHHNDYTTFLHSEHADVFRTTRGYFHPTLNAVIAYDGRNSGTQKTSRESFGIRTGELRRLEQAIESLPNGARLRCEIRGEPTRTLSRTQASKLHDDLERDLLRRELLLDQEWRAVDFGVAAHEMVHQLVAASGLAPRHNAFPIWLHEGFAAQFEVIRGGRWAGVGRAHDIRMDDWRKLTTPPLLLPLLRDSGFGQGYQPSSYAKAWALVYYLRLEHPHEFISFLDLLRLPPDPTPLPDGRIVSSFRSAFGPDLDITARAWQEYMAKVQTPLEEGEKTPEPRPAENPVNVRRLTAPTSPCRTFSKLFDNPCRSG